MRQTKLIRREDGVLYFRVWTTSETYRIVSVSEAEAHITAVGPRFCNARRLVEARTLAESRAAAIPRSSTDHE